MPAPFSEKMFPLDTPEVGLERRIDNHYCLEMIAENSSQLVAHQSQALRLQHDAAIANLRGMAEIANRQDQTNSLLSSLVGGMDRLNDSIDTLNATAGETLDAVYAQTDVLREGFEEMAQLMLQQQKVLHQIADTLSRPYETQALELLREADRALKMSMKTTGRDQKAEYADAARLLQDVLNNPIGSRNYVAWFQCGWLKWKNGRDLAGAEEAFYQASRLSASTTDLYHANSLRHMAYMQYLQNDFQNAYETIQKALKVMPDDHDIIYDAARYAAKTGHEAEALELLERCIDNWCLAKMEKGETLFV